MKTVFLYAGQGSQRPQMGKDFYDKYEIYKSFVDNRARELQAQGINITELMHNGSLEELSQTENTQVCMAVFAAGVTKLLKDKGVTPAASCGLSLGEYGALYAADVFEDSDFVDILAFRGREMMKAAKACDDNCCMSAILGLQSEDIERICENNSKEGFITVANYNCPGQTVICGDDTTVTKVEEECKQLGAKRCIRLNVSGPFHTKYMKPAAEALDKFFEDKSLNEPCIPVVANAIGGFYEKKDAGYIKQTLVKQVKQSVYLERNLMKLIDSGYTNFIEIGPGNTMAGFVRKTAKAMGKDINVMSIDKVEDFEKCVETYTRGA